MTRKEALAELLEKVEAGEWDLPEHDAISALDQQEVEDAFGHALHGQMYRGYHAYTGSLDAALALHKAVLPDEGWEVCERARYPNMMPSPFPGRYLASVGWGEAIYGGADNPARALLIAILKALIEGEE